MGKERYMSAIFLAISMILTLFFPMLSIPLNIFGIIFTKGKIRKTYGFLLAFCLAIIAFIWVPDNTMDLYRHHQQVKALADFDVAQLGTYIKAELEPMHYLIKFFVAQIGSHNLLEFIVVFCGYSELFWLICDLAELKQIKKSTLILILVYAFSSIRFIDFISGLWFNFAMINIGLGVYLEFFRNTKRIQYVLYALAVCLHVSALYAVVLLILINKLRVFKKVRFSVLLILFLTMVSFGGVVLLINNLFGSDSSLVVLLNRMYNGYFVNGAQFDDLHTGWELYLSLVNMTLCFVLGFWYCKKGKIKNEYGSLLVYLTVSVATILIGAGVFIRFKTLLVILLLPIIIAYLDTVKNKAKILLFISGMILLTSLQLFRSYTQAQAASLLEQVNHNVTNSVFYILENEG